MTDYTCFSTDNRIYFTGTIAEDSVMHLARCIVNLEQEKSHSVDKLITIYLSSTGGDVQSGLLLADIIDKTDLEIVIQACGFVGSAATLCLFVASEVKMYPTSTLFFHELSTGFYLPLDKAKQSLQHSEQLLDNVLRLYSRKLTINKDWLVEDRYISAEEALQLKIIDQIN